jgi:hypothetical protein
MTATRSSGRADPTAAASRPERGAAALLNDIMRSAATHNALKNLRSNHATPHNAQLRIIGLMWCTT